MKIVIVAPVLGDSAAGGPVHTRPPCTNTIRHAPPPQPPLALARRKKKAVHKTTSTDDKRLQNTLKRLGVNTIPGIEEVNIFKESNDVVHFVNPKGEGHRGVKLADG